MSGKQRNNKKFKSDDRPKDNLPASYNYWMTESSEYDCHFIVGPEEGPTERIGTVKVFLRGFSEPFRVMLGKGPLAAQGDITLTNIKPSTFKSFLKCVYGLVDSTIGSLDLTESMEFLSFVEMYLVTDLKPKIGRHLVSFLLSGFLDVYFIIISSPTSFQEEQLENALSQFTVENAENIFASELILQVSPEVLMYIVGNPQLRVSEVMIWEVIVKWAKHVKQTDEVLILREALQKHIEQIQFQNMTYEELHRKVFSTGILSEAKIIEVSKKYPVTFSYKAVEDMKNVYEVTISVTATNISNFTRDIRDAIKSQRFCFDRFFWFLVVDKLYTDRGNELFVSINCMCLGSESYRWKCKIEGKVTILSQFRKTSDHIVKFPTEELVGDYCKRFGLNLYPWEKLVDSTNGFVFNDSIIIRADIVCNFND